MSSESRPTSRTGAGRVVPRFKGQIHAIEPLLDLEGEWLLAAASRRQPDHGLGNAELAQLVTDLRSEGHITLVRRDYETGSARLVYSWNDTSRDALQAYVDQLDTFPCGHRVHVPDGRDAPDGKLPCKFCGELYDRETIKALL